LSQTQNDTVSMNGL